MESQDFIVTPVYFLILFALAYIFRSKFTDATTRKYFIPALLVRFFGALAVGFIYQFYYDGGDTYNFHTYGSRVLWGAILDSPSTGLQLFSNDFSYEGELYQYAIRVMFYGDTSSMTIVKIATIVDLFTFSTYSATALIFATFSFSGAWAFFSVFYKRYPSLHRYLAIGIFFVPSVFFWGSGIFKDTITLGALGWIVWLVDKILFERKIFSLYTLWLVLFCWIVFSIKIYILLCILPALVLWVSAGTLARIKSWFFKLMLLPVFILFVAAAGYKLIDLVGQGDARYSIDNIAVTAQLTAHDLGYITGKDAASRYTLGELDGTYLGLVKLIPAGINVSLFRPYLWEVRSPLMVLSAVESLALLLLTFYLIFKSNLKELPALLIKKDVLFCLAFAFSFAFAVGVSTYNFGTLSRYKIPVMPFYITGLALIWNSSLRSKKE